MRSIFALFAALGALSGPALAQDKPAVESAKVEAAIRSAFAAAPAEWQPRLVPDETMKVCAAADNAPPGPVFEAIQAREKAAVQYPPDGKLLGDWKKGEAVAQSGYGMRFSDYPPARANGGNCYACHQLTRTELSYGTIGPTLLGYGKARNFGADETKAVYDKIYNPHTTAACSLMPRFGANKVLSIEQIKDVVALLMDPESPVNK